MVSSLLEGVYGNKCGIFLIASNISRKREFEADASQMC